MAKTQKRIKRPTMDGTTPAGIAIFPKLNTPDFEYKKEHGEYSVKLRFSGEAAALLKKAIDKFHFTAWEEEENEHRVVLPGSALHQLGKAVGEPNFGANSFPYKQVYDDEHNAVEGTYTFKFTAKGGGSKEEADGTTSKWRRTLPLFDASGKATKAVIWGGSLIKCAFTAVSWCNAGLGYGVKLQLNGVQILKLVGPGAGRTSEELGFDVEEGDGFFQTSDEEETQLTKEADAEDASEAAAADPDF